MTTENEKATQTEEHALNKLSDEQLDQVAGGDFHVTKTVDNSSPNLFLNSTNGKHFTTATL